MTVANLHLSKRHNTEELGNPNKETRSHEFRGKTIKFSFSEHRKILSESAKILTNTTSSEYKNTNSFEYLNTRLPELPEY